MKSSEIKFKRIFDEGLYSGLHQLSDGNIITDDGCSFEIHKIILARSSDFFRAMFSGIDRSNTEYRISNSIDGNCMSEILCYIYTKDIDVTAINIKDLLIAADYFMLKDLYLEIKSYVKDSITDENCLKMCHAAHKLNENDIFQHCFKFLLRRFRQIMLHHKDDVVDLPKELLKCILSNRNLNVESERVVWKIIIHWAEASLPSRLQDVPSLLLALATDEIGEKLASEILNHNIVRNNIHIELPKSAAYFNDPNCNLKCLVKFLNDFPNDFQLQNFRIPRELNIISRYAEEYGETGTCEIFVSYDESPDLWRKVTEVNFEPGYLTAIDCNIFAFEKLGQRCAKFSLRTMEWKPMTSLRYYSYMVLAAENSIYVLGIHFDGLYHTEVYNADKNKWIHIASLDNTCRASAVAIGKNIFVVGVTYKLDCMITQMLNPITKQWIFRSAPKLLRYNFQLIAFHDKMYLIGGFNADHEAVPNAEVYDPATNLWKELPDFPLIYSWAAAIILNDQIIVYDLTSMQAEGECDSDAVRWNEIKERWERLEKTDLPKGLHQYRLSTISDVETVKVLTKQNRDSKVQMEKSPFSFL